MDDNTLFVDNIMTLYENGIYNNYLHTFECIYNKELKDFVDSH